MSSSKHPPDPEQCVSWAYSDASMQPYTCYAALAAVLPQQTVIGDARVDSITEAELLAAELAISYAPVGQPLTLYVDNTFVITALNKQHGHEMAFEGLGNDILILAEARGIVLDMQHVPGDENLAHEPAWSRHRNVERRPRQAYRFKIKRPLVQVQSEEINFGGIYEAPAGLYAMCELVKHLPPNIVAMVHGMSSSSKFYWYHPKQGGAEVHKQVKQALKILAEKNSSIQFKKKKRKKR